jgi:uncharacterized OsmC-like protein
MTATIEYQGDLRTTCMHLQSQNSFETDAPTDNQGKGERFSPTDLLATSLGACALTIMGIKARDMAVDLKGTRVEVLKIMKSDPRRVGGIHLTFHFPAETGADEKQRLIIERCARTCPVFYSIHPDIELDISFRWETAIAV